MDKECDFERFLQKVSVQESTFITLSGTQITVKIFDQGSKLALATSVYEGGNYIPQAVRRCLTQTSKFKLHSIQTFLKIDEGNFQISLNYLGHSHHLNRIEFSDLVEEFNDLATEWRLYLDEHDRNDLVHVRVQ